MTLAVAGTALPQLATLPTAEVFEAFWDPGTRRVSVATRLKLDDYQRHMSAEDWATAVALAERLRGRRIIFVNATIQGGGVVIMRKALIPLLKMLGVDCDWYVLAANTEAFITTKYCFHCNFQNTNGILPLTEERKQAYLTWIAGEFEALMPALATTDVFVCDDWQPSGLIPHIRQHGFKCVILFRDHIQSEGKLMVTPGTTQADAWLGFLWPWIQEAAVFAAHPVASFVPPNVPANRVTLMPATIEPNDDLLREVTTDEITRECAWLNELFVAHGSQPLDFSHPYRVLVARFDEAKNMPGALRFHARIVRQLLGLGFTLEQVPHLVIAGYAAHDDLSGPGILAQVQHLRSTKYRGIAETIHVARFEKARDLALNVLVRLAWLGEQPSTAEGFESRASDEIWLGIPCLGSTAGGIPLQILHGVSGFILDPHDAAAWSNIVIELFLNKDRYSELRRTTAAAAKTHTNRFTTGKNAISWMTLALLALENKEFDYGFRWADTLHADALATAA
jgi:hypothetical protein